ncbi:MAG: hypothetical protein PHT32_05760, partial [Candidatus Omnitrophica bacterium]|nr:hypothetical protein [Candidatus Omnitrophota bacterium]
MHKIKYLKKSLSVIITIAFLLNSLGIEPSFAQHPVGAGQSSAPTTSPMTVDAISILPSLGSISDSYRGTNGKTVIHIQDAHCNYSCQHSIDGLMDYLNKEYKVSTALLEGGAGKYDLSLFTDINDSSLRHKVSDYFVKEGRLNGAEFFAINNPGRITLRGLEDPTLYRENLKAYRDSLKDKDEAEKVLEMLRYYLANLKSHIYSPELQEFDAEKGNYSEKRIEFSAYLDYLAGISKETGIDLAIYKNLRMLMEILEREKGIDFKAANAERETLIDELTKRLSRVELETMAARSVEFKEGVLKEQEFYAYLFRKAKTVGLTITTTYPNLEKYRQYVEAYDGVDKIILFDEIERLENGIASKLCQNDTQKELYRLAQHLDMLKNLSNITLTRQMYDQYIRTKDSLTVAVYRSFIEREAPQNIKSAFYWSLRGVRPAKRDETTKQSNNDYSNARLLRFARNDDRIDILDNYRLQMEKFYDLALKRDGAFMKNIEVAARKDDTIIMVTGGFHTENMKQLLKTKGYSYITVMPKLDGNTESPYFRVLSGGKNEVERVIESALSAIAVPSMLDEMGIADPDGRVAVRVIQELLGQGRVVLLTPEGRYIILSTERTGGSKEAGQIAGEKIYQRNVSSLRSEEKVLPVKIKAQVVNYTTFDDFAKNYRFIPDCSGLSVSLDDAIDREMNAAIFAVNWIRKVRGLMDTNNRKDSPLIIWQNMRTGGLYPYLTPEIKQKMGIVDLQISGDGDIIGDIEACRGARYILAQGRLASRDVPRKDNIVRNIAKAGITLNAPIVMIDHSSGKLSGAQGHIVHNMARSLPVSCIPVTGYFDKDKLLAPSIFADKSFLLLLNANNAPRSTIESEETASYFNDQNQLLGPQSGQKVRIGNDVMGLDEAFRALYGARMDQAILPLLKEKGSPNVTRGATNGLGPGSTAFMTPGTIALAFGMVSGSALWILAGVALIAAPLVIWLFRHYMRKPLMRTLPPHFKVDNEDYARETLERVFGIMPDVAAQKLFKRVKALDYPDMREKTGGFSLGEDGAIKMGMCPDPLRFTETALHAIMYAFRSSPDNVQWSGVYDNGLALYILYPAKFRAIAREDLTGRWGQVYRFLKSEIFDEKEYTEREAKALHAYLEKTRKRLRNKFKGIEILLHMMDSLHSTDSDWDVSIEALQERGDAKGGFVEIGPADNIRQTVMPDMTDTVSFGTIGGNAGHEGWEELLADTQFLSGVDMIAADFDGVIKKREQGKVENRFTDIIRSLLDKRSVAHVLVTGEVFGEVEKRLGPRFGWDRINLTEADRDLFWLIMSTGAIARTVTDKYNFKKIQGFGETDLNNAEGRIVVAVEEIVRDAGLGEALDTGTIQIQKSSEGVSIELEKLNDADILVYKGKILPRLRKEFHQIEGVLDTAEVVCSATAIDIIARSKGSALAQAIRLKKATRVFIFADSVGTKDDPGNDRSMLELTENQLKTWEPDIDWKVELVKIYVGIEPKENVPEGCIIAPRPGPDSTFEIYDAVDRAKTGNVTCGTICEAGHQELLDPEIKKFYEGLWSKWRPGQTRDLDADPLRQREVIDALSETGVLQEYGAVKDQIEEIISHIRREGKIPDSVDI